MRFNFIKVQVLKWECHWSNHTVLQLPSCKRRQIIKCGYLLNNNQKHDLMWSRSKLRPRTKLMGVLLFLLLDTHSKCLCGPTGQRLCCSLPAAKTCYSYLVWAVDGSYNIGEVLDWNRSTTICIYTCIMSYTSELCHIESNSNLCLSSCWKGLERSNMF